MTWTHGVDLVQSLALRMAAGPALPALAAALLTLELLRLEPRGRAGLVPVVAVIALAWLVATGPAPELRMVPLGVGVAIAALARDRDELLHGECALKLAWVMGSALALSWAGLHLLTLATGTPWVPEQWAVLSLGLDASFLWSTALPLSLLAGLVLLGGAPFHFWVADVFQGVRPWLAPLVVASLQVAGAGWLVHRLAGIAAFPAAAELARSLLVVASLAASISGAATLTVQRRPERRAGTLASLQGGLLLAMLAGGRLTDAWVGRWAAHLVLAYVGAATLVHFLPVSTGRLGAGAPLFRRHPVPALAGLLALASLAGVPGTPGMGLWLDGARALVARGHVFTAVAFGIAWLASIAAVLAQMREGFGLPSTGTVHAVPRPARVALGGSGVLLLAMAVLGWAGR
jgi:NADH:ubiquinone oxidoreductase subunit 2 (subunit N)